MAASASAVALLPVGYLLVRLLELSPAEVLDRLGTPRVGELATRSLLLAAIVSVLCLLVGVGAALVVTRTDLPLRRLFAVLAALPLAVPSYVAAFSWTSVADLWSGDGRFDGFAAAVLVLTLYTYPYVYLPVAAALVGANPAQEEVARSLGLRGPAVLRRVVLPRIRAAVTAGGLLCALYVLSDFGAVSILRVDTFTRAIFTSVKVGFDRAGAVTLSALLLVLTALVLTAEARTRRRDPLRTRGTTRRTAPVVGLGRWRLPVTAAMTLLAALSLGVPALALVRWSLRGVSEAGTLVEVLAATSSSLGVSLAGAALTTLLAVPIGVRVARVPGRFSRLLEGSAYLTHSLPGVVVALSLVFFGINVAYALYQSVWLLAFAYAALFLPLGVGAVAGAVTQTPPAVEEVSRSLGRGPVRTFWTVTLPLAAPGVGAGAALTFLAAMKELPATLMLRPTGMETLATELWQQTSVQAYAAAAPYAALLVVIAAVPTAVLTVQTGLVTSRRRPARACA